MLGLNELPNGGPGSVGGTWFVLIPIITWLLTILYFTSITLNRKLYKGFIVHFHLRTKKEYGITYIQKVSKFTLKTIVKITSKIVGTLLALILIVVVIYTASRYTISGSGEGQFVDKLINNISDGIPLVLSQIAYFIVGISFTGLKTIGLLVWFLFTGFAHTPG